ncbi:MAG: hypothetical protein E7409_05950 [Ruminococcaceae bacterium]|nr:hypothetical protein [Oscillospiraceae bacterium]
MKKRAFLYIILAGIFWGTSGLFVHALAPFGFSSIQMAATRGVVSSICLLTYVLLKNRSLFRATPKELLLFAGSGVSMFITASSYYFAMQVSSVSTAVVLMYTAPIIVLLYSVTFLGEKMTRLKTISVICMLAGCALVSGVIGGIKFSWLGIVFGLLSGVAYGSYNIFTKIQMKNKSNPISASMYCFIFMAIVAIICAKPVHFVSIASQCPWQVFFYLVGCGVCTGVIPYFLYTLALKALPAGTASALGIIEPMSATIFSVVFLNERLGFFPACGIALIIGAVVMLSKSNE